MKMKRNIESLIISLVVTCFIINSSMSMAQPTQEVQGEKEVQVVQEQAVQEQAAVETQKVKQEKSIKVVPFKSFFSKLKKKEKKEIPIVNDVPLYEGNVVYNLDDCIKLGLKNSPYVKNLRETKEAQKHEVSSAKSSYFPQISAGTGYSYGHTNYSGRGIHRGTTSRNGYGLDLSISEMIFDFGRTIAKINMHKFNYEAACYDLEDGILETVFEIKVAYTNVLASRARRTVLLQNVKINELNVDRTRAMYEVGLKSKIDLVNAEANLTAAEIALFEGEKEYQEKLVSLNSAMYYLNAPTYFLKPTGTFNFGEEVKIKNEVNVSYDKSSYGSVDDLSIKEGAIFTAGIEKRSIVDQYDLHPFELSLQETINTAFANRFDLKSMKLVKKAAEESLKAIKRSWYPELNVSAGYGLGVNAYNVSGVNGNIQNSVSLYGGLDFPVINGMYIKNQVDIAKINVEKAQNNIEMIENNIYFEIQDLYITMEQLEKKIPLMKKRVEQFRENFELADGRYAVGLGDYIALQEAITDYNNAQLSFIEAVLLYDSARFELEKAMAIVYKP